MCVSISPHPTPSRQAALTNAYTRVVDKLKAQGFRSAFVDVEFFVRGDTEDEWAAPGAVRVMEVNTRCFPQLAPVYRNCLRGGSQYEALVVLGIGQKPRQPERNGLVGSNFYLNLFMPHGEKPVAAAEVIDFDAAAKLDEDVEMKVERETMLGWNEATAKCGLCVAMFYVYSSSLALNEKRAAEIRRGLVSKRPELLP